MKKPNHESIYLIPGSYDGEQCYVWSDDPAPGAEDNPEDAVKYVRADLAQSNEMLANRIVELTNESDALAAQIEDILNSDFTPEQYHRLMHSSFAVNARVTAVMDFANVAFDAFLKHKKGLFPILTIAEQYTNKIRQSAKAGAA